MHLISTIAYMHFYPTYYIQLLKILYITKLAFDKTHEQRFCTSYDTVAEYLGFAQKPQDEQKALMLFLALKDLQI